MSPHTKLLSLVQDIADQKYPEHAELFRGLDETRFKALLDEMRKEKSEPVGSEFGLGDLWDQLPVILAIIQTGLQIIDFWDKNKKKDAKEAEDKARQLSEGELPKQLEANKVLDPEKQEAIGEYTKRLAEIAKS